MITKLFTIILYQPLFNLLVFLYNLIPGHDLGVAIIILTILIRFVLYPLSLKSIRSQRKLQNFQPELEAIKKKYKSREEQSRAVMEFYRKNKINPFSSCLPVLIQFPILIALYQVFRDGVSNPESLNLLYPFISNPGHLEADFLGFLDLSKRNWYLALLTGLVQFWQSKMLVKKRKKQKKKELDTLGAITSNMSNQMVYLMPLITVFFALSFPAGLALYWFVTTLFSVAQQWLVMRKKEAPSR